MSDYSPSINECAQERASGQCAVVAALVIALHEDGVLSQEKYCDVLQRLWTRMPESEAVGEAGAVIECMLEILGDLASTVDPSKDGKYDQRAPTFVGRPVNDDAIEWHAQSPL